MFSAQPLADAWDTDGAPPLQQFGQLDVPPDFVLDESLAAVPSLTPFLHDAHDLTGVHQVHDMGLDGSGQTVVIIDSGIAWDHEALGAGFGAGHQIVGGWDFAEGDADPYDDGPRGFHGTHVAGIIGSNDRFDMGVAPGADLVALRVFSDQGEGQFGWVEDALQWVHDHRHDFENPITTVNLSLGAAWNAETLPSWAMLEDELAQLEVDGIFISVAAGNSFGAYQDPGLAYPAVSPHVVPVASVDSNDVLSTFSQRSDRALLAPGQSIISTIPDHATTARDGRINDFGVASGTSMAAPYVAGSAVLVRQAMEMAGLEQITQDTIYQHLRATADAIYDSVTDSTYFRINVLAAIESLQEGQAGRDAQEVVDDAPAIVDLGEIHVHRAAALSVAGTTRFSVTASRDGLLAARVDDGLDVTIFGQGTELARGGGAAHALALAGQTYEIQISGSDDSYDLTVANQVAVVGGRVEVHGAAVPDDITLDLDSRVLVVNGIEYETDAEMFTIRGGDGEGDRLSVAADHMAAALRPSVTHLHGAGVKVIAAGFERVEASAATGSAALLGTAMDDRLRMAPQRSDLTGDGYELTARGFQFVTALGFGGRDQAALIGSSTADTLHAWVGRAQLIGAGGRLTAVGFETVHASGEGGADRAYLFDSEGDDHFSAAEGNAVMDAGGVVTTASGFARTYAVASNGYDTAVIEDTPGDDRFTSMAEQSYMDGGGLHVHARSFDRVEARAVAGGRDRASFYDSPGDDRFTAMPDYASMRGAGFHNEGLGFEQVVGFAYGGGLDETLIYDGAGDDHLKVTTGGLLMTGEDYRIAVRRFESFRAYANMGGQDTGELSGRWQRWSQSGEHLTAEAPTVQGLTRGFAVQVMAAPLTLATSEPLAALDSGASASAAWSGSAWADLPRVDSSGVDLELRGRLEQQVRESVFSEGVELTPVSEAVDLLVVQGADPDVAFGLSTSEERCEMAVEALL